MPVFPKICVILFIYFYGHTCSIWKFPDLRVKLELQLLAHTTATATQDPSCVCNLHYSSWQHQILNPLSKARDGTCILMAISLVHYCYATLGTPCVVLIVTQKHAILTFHAVPTLICISFQFRGHILFYTSQEASLLTLVSLFGGQVKI